MEYPKEIKIKKKKSNNMIRSTERYKIKKRRPVKIECPVCHFLITIDSQARYNKTKIHQDHFKILL
jgi:hypothetical protein